jgi:hypothetical protein
MIMVVYRRDHMRRVGRSRRVYKTNVEPMECIIEVVLAEKLGSHAKVSKYPEKNSNGCV